MVRTPRVEASRHGRPGAHGRSGFTLVEALVALLLASVLLLGGLAIQGAERRAARRRLAHIAAERALANTYESVRGGLVPLASGAVAAPTLGFAGTITLEVTAEPQPALYRIDLVALYDADGSPSRRTLEALLYRP